MPSSTFRLIHDNVDRSLLRQRSCCTCESSLVLLSLTTSRSDALAVNLARVVFGDSETRAACVYTALRDKRSSVARSVSRIWVALVDLSLSTTCCSVAYGVSRILAALVDAALRAKRCSVTRGVSRRRAALVDAASRTKCCTVASCDSRCSAAHVALFLLRCCHRAVGESSFSLE